MISLYLNYEDGKDFLVDSTDENIEEELQKFIHECGENYNDSFADFVSMCKSAEFTVDGDIISDNIDNIAKYIDDILEVLNESYNWSDVQEKVFKAILEDFNDDIEDAFKIVRDEEYNYIGDYEEYIDELLQGSYAIPDNIMWYIDKEKMWSDMQLEGSYIELDNGEYIELY